MGLPSKITMTSKIITAVLLVVVMFGQALQTRHDAASAEPSATRSRRGFGIHGFVGHLYPGRHTVLVLRVRNYQSFPLMLHRITAKVRRPSARCAGGNVRIRPYTRHRRIGAGSWILVRLRVRMRRTAPDGCQDTHFHLTYHGKAVQA